MFSLFKYLNKLNRLNKKNNGCFYSMSENINRAWIDQHYELLKKEKYKEGIAFLNSKLPTKLYKYRPLNDYTLECLTYNSIYLSRIDQLNDPYDCYPIFTTIDLKNAFFRSPGFRNQFQKAHNIALSDDEYNRIVNSADGYKTYSEICLAKGLHRITLGDADANIVKETQAIVAEFRDRTGISSFSETNDSTIMWSHYSDHHKGICIEYDFIVVDKETIHRIYPVYYTDDLPQITFIDGGNSFIHASLQKGLAWKYEKEWRMAMLKEEWMKSDHYKTPVPTAIYLGSHFHLNSQFKKLQLQKIISENKIPIHKMKIHESKYKMVIDK